MPASITATVHKAQSVTVDRVHVLATPGLDRHAAYVALSRHRDAVDVHYGRDDFADPGKLVRALSRERGKDMASDYQRAPEPAHVASPPRNPFAGLKLGRAPISEPRSTSLDKAVERYARAAADILRMRTGGMEELPHQRTAFTQAGRELGAIRSRGRARSAQRVQCGSWAHRSGREWQNRGGDPRDGAGSRAADRLHPAC